MGLFIFLQYKTLTKFNRYAIIFIRKALRKVITLNKMYFLDKDKIVTTIEYSYMTEEVKIQNYESHILRLPFGVVQNPTFAMFEDFLESRCFPRTRYNAKQLLARLGLTTYEPLDIIRKTHGVQNEDTCWIRFEGEELCYDDVKFRD